MKSLVLIIGAGPAGASAAIALAQRGVKDIVLADRSDFPRDKTCGSGLSPNALTLAKELGISAEVDRLGVQVRSLKVVTRGGREMVLSSGASAVILLRKDFDNLLVERAKSLGVTFVGGFQAFEAIRENGRMVGARATDGRELRGDYVLACDGAHSIFSEDPRPKRSISTLMGWWEDAEVTPGQIEMIFDRNVAPLYGWLFPETPTRVNIGICIDGQDADGQKTQRNVRSVFDQFVQDHYAGRLKNARQIGRLKGHPIVWTTRIDHVSAPGVLYVGEAARITHNATGEGISQGMQSGVFAAQAIADVVNGRATEPEAWKRYLAVHRKAFTPGFVAGHALRALIDSPALDAIAAVYNHPLIRRGVVRVLGSALAGTSVSESRAA